MPGRIAPTVKIAALAALAWAASGAARAGSAEDLTNLSLEQLMNEPVTSVSKRETKLSQAAAAIAVISQEDLRRLGITTLAEALRLVPGMDVARIAANQWAISARGFNDEFADKLLVLIDGRSVYSPNSAGVLWNSNDVVFADVDRIEVIRGPGASLWGANAVNGVVNVITKSAKETLGGLLVGAAGSQESPVLTARYGDRSGEDFYWRAYAKYYDRESFEDVSRTVDQGEWHSTRIGFRMDWKAFGADNVTVQGDAYTGVAGNQVNNVTLVPAATFAVNSRNDNSGADLLGRWTRRFSADSELTVQAYFDHTDQGDGYANEARNAYDLDVQHRWKWNPRNELVWGVGYRYSALAETSNPTIVDAPLDLDIRLFDLFAQNEIVIVPARLSVTLGSKFEYNNLSSWSVEPDIRVLFTPTERQSLWGSVSRAVRTPSQFELYGTLNLQAFQPGPTSPPVLVAIIPDPNLKPENLLAYQAGYRIEPAPWVSLDLTGFVNHYHHLIGRVQQQARFVFGPGPPHLLIPLLETNSVDANTYGAEAAVQLQPLRTWKVIGSYSWLHIHAWPDLGIQHASPHDQFQVRSYLDLPYRLEFNAALYCVDSITAPSYSGFVHIPTYVRGDAGVTWQATTAMQIGLWGQNLFDRRHLESGSLSSTLLVPVPESWLLKLTWKL